MSALDPVSIKDSTLVDEFSSIWKAAGPVERRQIFDIVWKDVENLCLAAKKKPPCPYEKIKDLYHEILPECPTIVKLTIGRKRHILARWREYHSIEYWRQYFTMVRKIPFLMGQVSGNDGRGPFIADIDFLIKESSWIKVLEGRYTR